MIANQTKETKIAIVTDTLCDANGVSRFLQDMAQEALNARKALTIITSTRKNRCKSLPNLQILNPALFIPMPFYKELDLVFPNISKLSRLLQEIDPDIVHISTPGPVGLVGYFWARKHRKAVTGTYHTNFPAYIYNNTKLRFFERITQSVMHRFYKNFALVFARSEAYEKVLTDEIRLQATQVHTLPHGSDLSKFNPTFRNPSIWNDYPGIRPQSLKAIYVGRLSVEKNFPFLREVFNRFRQSHSEIDIQLIAIGEGDGMKQKAQLLEEEIILLGFKTGVELSTLYASADLFLFPSVTDTLGQTVMEAQASGLPALVSDVGGPQIIVQDHTTGTPTGFVLPIDAQRWCDALKQLCQTPRLRQRYGDNAVSAMRHRSIGASFETFWSRQTALLP